ncbi:hypothetical protein [Streptomyces sp. NBC_00996]|uniref:hypothetical protein n=1 Tax=Streptomyces sp. NBC_00996 TaxID=2903710 RepID=UPI0038649FAD|nr:hypothetical protein OG390_44905 [Streptomyces sp. NBC_00996]
MSGLEILVVVGAAYLLGHIRQWQKNRDAVKTAEALKRITDAMRNQGKGNGE